MIPPLSDKDFINLEVLNLSYNKFNFESIRSLYTCRNLKQLDLAANNLEQLPDDMFHF
jgi:Leucine-rich repeat (LRR) protein